MLRDDRLRQTVLLSLDGLDRLIWDLNYLLLVKYNAEWRGEMARRWLPALIAQRTERQKRILHLRFEKMLSVTAVAHAIGVPAKYGSAYIKDVLLLLDRAMERRSARASA